MDKKALLSLASVTTISLLGFGLMMPLIPFLAKSQGASPAIIGTATAFYSLGQLISAPFWGYISDVKGRRIVLIFSQIGFSICWMLIALPFGVKWLLATRFAAGLFGGNIAVTFATAADIAGPKNYNKANGIIGAALSLGFTFGPVLGSLLGSYFPEPALFVVAPLVAASLSFISLIMVILWVKETLTPEQKEKNLQKHIREKSFWHMTKDLLKYPPASYGLLIIFLTIFSWAGLEILLTLFCLEKFGWNIVHMGYAYLTLGLIVSFAQGGLTPRIGNFLKRKTHFLSGALLISLGFFLLVITKTPLSFYISLFPLGIGIGIFSPLLNTLLLENTPVEERGFVMGLSRSASTLGRFTGPILLSTLFGFANWLPFSVGTILILTTIPLFFLLLATREKPVT